MNQTGNFSGTAWGLFWGCTGRDLREFLVGFEWDLSGIFVKLKCVLEYKSLC
jgi:hypothetical protein